MGISPDITRYNQWKSHQTLAIFGWKQAGWKPILDAGGCDPCFMRCAFIRTREAPVSGKSKAFPVDLLPNVASGYVKIAIENGNL